MEEMEFTNGSSKMGLLELIIIVVSFLLIILFLVFVLGGKKKDKMVSKRRVSFETGERKKVESMEVEVVEKERDFIYLSELEDYLKDYELEVGEQDSFFKLRDNIFNDGKRIAREEIERIVNSDKDVREKMDLLIQKFEEFEEGKYKLKTPKWGEKKKNSPKIYYSAIYDYIKELGIDTKSDEPRDVFYKVLNEIYLRGIMTILSNIGFEIRKLKEIKEQEDLSEDGRLSEISKLIEKIREEISK